MSSRDWEALIHRHLNGVATSEEVTELSERLEADAETRLMYLRLARIHAMLAADDFDEPSILESENRFSDLMDQLEALDQRRRFHRFVTSVAAVAAVITLMAGLYIFRPRIESRIATISSINGAIRWTGAGGQVYVNVEPGRELTGGTLESLSVDSSTAVEFRDGSTVTISGLSVLIISDDGQKELHLREGNLSATVEAQPQAKPLRLLTPATVLEVLGTQFVVTIDAREPLAAKRLKKPTSAWKANLLQDKVEGMWISASRALKMEIDRALNAGEITSEQIGQVYGERLAGLREDEGFLRANPRSTGREGASVLYVALLNVPHRQGGPILLSKGGRFQIQGRVKNPSEVTFGLSVASRDRSIRGEFEASRQVESNFDIEIPVAEFQVRLRGDAVSAAGLEVSSWFCFTAEPGLEITHVELLAP